MWHRKPSQLEKDLVKLTFKERDATNRLLLLCQRAAEDDIRLSYAMERHPFKGESLRVFEQLIRQSSGEPRFVACEVLAKLYPHSPRTAAALKDALLAETDLKLWHKVAWLGTRLEFIKDRLLIDLLAALLERDPNTALVLPLGAGANNSVTYDKMTHRDFYLKEIRTYYRGPEGQKFDGFDAEVLTEFDHKYAATQALGASQWFPTKWLNRYKEKLRKAPKVPAARLPWLFKERGPEALIEILEKQPKVFLENLPERMFPKWQLSKAQFQRAWKLMPSEVRDVIGHSILELSLSSLTVKDLLKVLSQAPGSRASVSALRELDRLGERPTQQPSLAKVLQSKLPYNKDLVARVFLKSRNRESFKTPKWDKSLPVPSGSEVRALVTSTWVVISSQGSLTRLSRATGDVVWKAEGDFPLVTCELETGVYVGTAHGKACLLKEHLGKGEAQLVDCEPLKGRPLLNEPVESVRRLGEGRYLIGQSELNPFGDLSHENFLIGLGKKLCDLSMDSSLKSSGQELGAPQSVVLGRKVAAVQSYDEQYDFPDSSEAGGRLLLPRMKAKKVTIAAFTGFYIGLCLEGGQLRALFW